MPEPYTVKPDRGFIQRVLRDGGGDLKKCFQCATCSVVCELSTGSKPFPRKEMVWAQWGLKDRLVADPNVWLCHQCNDCSTKCPRGARPGDVLAAVRQEGVRHYAFPRVFGELFDRAAFLPLLLGVVPAVLLFLALWLRGPIESIAFLKEILHFLGHPGFYADFFPHWLLIGFFSSLSGLAGLAAVVGIVRFWRAMVAADKASDRAGPALGIVPAAIRVGLSIFRHDKFSRCVAGSSRRLAHLGAFYGFAALFMVTVWAVIALYVINPIVENDLHYPFGLLNGWKILANVGCVLLIAGCVLAIRDRLRGGDEVGTSTPFDLVFVGLLLAVGVTGLATEVARLAIEPMESKGLVLVAYSVYFLHLVVVFDLLIYLPYSKFAHLLYRTTALIYAEHSGRNEGVVAER